jgi:hypothetical protein
LQRSRWLNWLFFRAYKGQSSNANLQSVVSYDLVRYGITLQSQNLGSESVQLRVQNLYDNETITQLVKRSRVFEQFWPLEKVSGCYSLVIRLNPIRLSCNNSPATSKTESTAPPIPKSAAS